MRKIAALCIALAFLMSCVGIDSTLKINDNGSGSLVLTYRVSQLVVDLGASSSSGGAIPLPISKSDFERSLEAAKGKVSLTKFVRTEDEKDVTIMAELAFDSIDDLGQLDAFREADLKLVSDGTRHTFSQLIARTPSEPVSEDTLRMIDALSDGYDLTFKVQAPKAIQSATLGTLGADKRLLTYTISIKDVMQAKQDIALSVTW